MIEVLWPDGRVNRARTFAELEQVMRASEPYPYKTRREYRREMRARAFVMSGRKPSPGAPWTSRAFVMQLANAGMFHLHQTEDAE